MLSEKHFWTLQEWHTGLSPISDLQTMTDDVAAHQNGKLDSNTSHDSERQPQFIF